MHFRACRLIDENSNDFFCSSCMLCQRTDKEESHFSLFCTSEVQLVYLGV